MYIDISLVLAISINALAATANFFFYRGPFSEIHREKYQFQTNESLPHSSLYVKSRNKLIIIFVGGRELN